jgi:hypothetical protein
MNRAARANCRRDSAGRAAAPLRHLERATNPVGAERALMRWSFWHARRRRVGPGDPVIQAAWRAPQAETGNDGDKA